MNVERISDAAGAAEPVTGADLMTWGRITDPAEQATCDRLVKVARQEVERFTGFVLLPGVFRVITEWVGVVEIPLYPVTVIDAVRGIDPEGALTAMTGYSSLLRVAPALVRPNAYGYAYTGIEVQAQAGYATPGDVPEELRHAVLDVALLHYQHRDDPDLLVKVRAYLGTLSTAVGVVQI